MSQGQEQMIGQTRLYGTSTKAPLERALGNVLWGIDTTACVIANTAEEASYSVEVIEAKVVKAREDKAR